MLTVEGLVMTLLVLMLVTPMTTAGAVLLTLAASTAWTRWKARRAGSGATCPPCEPHWTGTEAATVPLRRSSP